MFPFTKTRRWIPVVLVAVTALIGVIVTHVGAGHRHGVRLRAIVTTTSTSTTSTTLVPAPLAPLAAGMNPLPGEGQWVAAGRTVSGQAAVFTTTLRPPSGGLPVGVARIDTTRLRVVLFAGTTQPGGTWSAQAAVPPTVAPSLVAAFNSGFQFGSSAGGFYADGHADPPFRDGAASLVVHADGSAEVGDWGRDATLTPNVAEVRQNLTLLVDNGAPAATASSPGLWGATIGNVAATWRSAVGSDSAGHLFFAGGPSLRPLDLAAVLVAAGATRAMELDINPQWVFFDAFTDDPAGGTIGTKLLTSMNYSPLHVLTPGWRDFVAVLLR